jgi:intN1
MTPGSIINGAIEYMLQKTKGERPQVVRVSLNARAKALIEKYAVRDDLNGKLFPFISSQKNNVAIKKIFTTCGVNRMVTVLNPTTGAEEKRSVNEIASSHLARRTFIGNLYKKVKDPNLVGSLSGHKEGSKAFARYRDINEDMKKELVSLLD